MLPRRPGCDHSHAIYRSLPRFSNLAELRAQPRWLQYLDSVYGEETLQFPLDTRTFNFFYSRGSELFTKKHLASVALLGRRPYAGLERNQTPAVTLAETLIKAGGGTAKWFGLCGRQLHDAFRLYHNPPYPANAAFGTLWLYGHVDDTLARGASATALASTVLESSAPEPEPGLHPSGGFPSHTLVEIMHCAEEAEADARDFWMYIAAGSGIYFDLGRTVAFRDRCELWRSQRVPMPKLSFRFFPRCGIYASDWLTGKNATSDKNATFAELRTDRCPGFWCGAAADTNSSFLLPVHAHPTCTARCTLLPQTCMHNQCHPTCSAL